MVPVDLSGSTTVDLINYGNGNLNYILGGSGIELVDLTG